MATVMAIIIIIIIVIITMEIMSIIIIIVIGVAWEVVVASRISVGEAEVFIIIPTTRIINN